VGDEKLRVAIFSDSALPILNGVSVSVDLLVRGLRNQGHSVHVFTAAHFRFRDPDPNTYRFPAVETPWTKNYPLAIPPFYGMLRKFRRHEFDLIHSHTPFTIGFVGLRWAESHGLPIVATYHTLYDRYAHYIPYFPRRYVRFKIAKHTNFYYNSVDHIITPSQAALRWLQRHSVDRPITVIPTGAPDRQMLDRYEVRRQLQIPPEQKVLLYVGRVAPEKNLGFLLRAVAEVVRRDPSVRLWLVGDGPYRQTCVELARDLGIGDRVTFAGYVPRADVDKYYAAADLFVFSSITETQGLVVQEAMTYGLPAVAVAGGGASDSIVSGKNGIVVKHEEALFAEAVLNVLASEEEQARLSAGALKSVRANSADAMTERVVEVYREVIRHKHAAASPVLKEQSKSTII
jgi:glycosyltransferase involved in cell wall biosynthesis